MKLYCAWSPFLENWDRRIINKIDYYYYYSRNKAVTTNNHSPRESVLQIAVITNTNYSSVKFQNVN